MDLHVRRATLEDVGPLVKLWQSMHFAADDLARRVTEFQVVETADHGLVGALGFQILERQGRIHSEAFTDFALAELSRPLLWDRVNSLAQNHGLLRIWTHEEAPFWSRCGLSKPDADALARLPAAWKPQSGRLLTLKLRDDLDTIMTLDHEFALFMQNEREKTQRTLQRAKHLKILAALVAFGVFLAVIAAAFLLARRHLLAQ
ncbi:MAG: hypothetical protein IT579_00480 [Verrucomicrobia subdivision 3 bacterium]|nr:hypothetical protein [Limisphaerales bacterium]